VSCVLLVVYKDNMPEALKSECLNNRTKLNFFGKARELKFARLLHIASPKKNANRQWLFP